jgi:tetratricopeptide (TPR) repeat protein
MPDDRYTLVMSRVESCHHFIETNNLKEAVDVILPVADTLRFWGVYQELSDILVEIEGCAEAMNQSLDPRLRIEQCAALHAQGNVELAITILKELVNTGEGEIKIKALQELGWIYAETGNRREAENLLLQSLQLAHEDVSPKLEGEALYKLQYNAYHESNFAKVMEYNEQRLNIFRKMEDDPEVREAIAWIYHDIGNVYREQGHYDDALKLYQQDLDLWRSLGNSPFRVGWLNYDIGQIYRDQGKFQEALQKLKIALQIFQDVKYLYGIAHVMIEIGRVSSKFDDSSKSIKQVEDAIIMLGHIKAPAGESYALGALSDIYLKRNELDQALLYSQQSLALDTTMNNIKGMAKSFHRIGLIYEQKGIKSMENGDQKLAHSYFQEALESVERAQTLFFQIRTVPNFCGIADDALRIKLRHQ